MQKLIYSLAFGLAILIGASSIHTNEAFAAKKSLLERLGGAKAVGSVTIEFVNVLAADARVTKNNPAVKDAFASTNVLKLKQKLYQLLCMVTGGPCKYTGKNMVATHVGLRITELEWFYMLDDLVIVLDKFSVPEKLKNEVLAIIATTKKDIINL